MRANRAYRLIVKRRGWAPALFADPTRVDHVEVVDVDDGEVVLFWDCPPREATLLARRLRVDLGQLEDDQFLARWSGYGAEAEH